MKSGYHIDDVCSVFNADCIDVMKSEIGVDSIDLTVTSPPYDDLRSYDSNQTVDFWEVIRGLYHVTAPGGIVVWNVSDQVIDGNESGSSFKQALIFQKLGFKLAQTIIWNKPPQGFKGGGKLYRKTFEYVFVFSKGKPKTLNLLKDYKSKYRHSRLYGSHKGRDGNVESHGRKPAPYAFSLRSNVWTYPTGLYNTTHDKIAFQHPAVMPDKLAEDLIHSFSNIGDLIFDPFVGSGTTMKAAIKLLRNAIGSEINPAYMDIISKRLDRYRGQKKIV